MMGALAVTVTSYGEGRQSVLLARSEATVGDAVKRTGYSTDGRRIALNGQRAGAGAGVQEGDLVTLMPRVVGG